METDVFQSVDLATDKAFLERFCDACTMMAEPKCAPKNIVTMFEEGKTRLEEFFSYSALYMIADNFKKVLQYDSNNLSLHRNFYMSFIFPTAIESYQESIHYVLDEVLGQKKPDLCSQCKDHVDYSFTKRVLERAERLARELQPVIEQEYVRDQVKDMDQNPFGGLQL